MTNDHGHWCDDHANLAALFRWMRDRDEEPDPVEFLEKPWKWTPEWDEMNKKEHADG